MASVRAWKRRCARSRARFLFNNAVVALVLVQQCVQQLGRKVATRGDARRFRTCEKRGRSGDASLVQEVLHFRDRLVLGEERINRASMR